MELSSRQRVAVAVALVGFVVAVLLAVTPLRSDKGQSCGTVVSPVASGSAHSLNGLYGGTRDCSTPLTQRRVLVGGVLALTLLVALVVPALLLNGERDESDERASR
jgi:hypothetical protein